MLKLYDYFGNRPLSALGQPERNFKYYATDLMEELGYEKPDEIELSLKRTFMICQSMKISIPKNFRKVYRFDGEKITSDWKLSSLACYIMVMNGNPSNPNVAKAQLIMLGDTVHE